MGSIGRRHLRLVRAAHPEADIRVLRHRVVDELVDGADGSFSNLDDALRFRPQVAVVANPASLHIPVTQALLASGCHVLVEKPIAACNDGVTDCINQAYSSGVVLQVGYNLRFLTSLVEFRRRVLLEEIGQVFSIRCEIGQYLPTWRPGTDYQQGVSAQAELGGGALLELSHELDYLRWIFGEVAWVSAWTGQLSGLGLAVEDTAHLTLGFSGDTAVAAVSLDFSRRDTTRQCVAIGTKGSLRWNALAGSVDLYLPEVGEWSVVYESRQGRDDSYVAQWQAFCRSVETGIAPMVKGEDGLAVLNVVEAAKQSNTLQGLRVELP